MPEATRSLRQIGPLLLRSDRITKGPCGYRRWISWPCPDPLSFACTLTRVN
jgi:hypothetical protein